MDQLPTLRAPYVHALVKAATSQELSVGREGDAVDRLLVPGERVKAGASLHVPQSHSGVKAGAGQHQVHVGVGGAWACGTPLDSVNLLLVGLEVVQALVPVHAPDLEGHVIGAGRQELALRIPFDGVDLVGVALEGFDGLVMIKLAHMDLFVCGAGGKALL